MATLYFINSRFVFSLFPNLLTAERPQEDIDINQLIEVIKFGYLKDTISKLRSAATRDIYDSIKKEKIPCVTLSGTFTRRANNGLIRHSGLMQIDVDKVDNYSKVFDQFCSDQFVYVCFRSPGGQGIKAIVKVKPSADTHKNQFLALQQYFKKEYNLEIDSLCKDVSRAMLISFDPQIFCNPGSMVFEEMLSENKTNRQVRKPAKTVDASRHDDKTHPSFTVFDIDLLERIIYKACERRIDLTATYKDWIKIGYALCATFGEPGRKYFHDLGRLYPRYTSEETDKKYSELLLSNTGQSTIRSIIYLAKRAGIYLNQ